MSKPSSVILVVEDDYHKRLVYQYLKRRVNPHVIRIEISPSGRGSAESWVRERLVLELREYRRRQAETRLIVVIDADKNTVQERMAQLDQSLKDAAVSIARHHIARLVPKRNVETWILCLNAEDVNEEDDYTGKGHNWDRLIPSAAIALFERTQSVAPAAHGMTASLRMAIDELRRLSL